MTVFNNIEQRFNFIRYNERLQMSGCAAISNLRNILLLVFGMEMLRQSN